MKLAGVNRAQLLSTYGMVAVLLLLCAVFSVATLETQHPSGATGGEQAAAAILAQADGKARVLILARKQADERQFAAAAEKSLISAGASVVTVIGDPREARAALAAASEPGEAFTAIAATQPASEWGVVIDRGKAFPQHAAAIVVTPQSYRWPTFLRRANLLNIADQIAVIAIVAVGMTVVIITGGIDLSVGSLIALSAVITAIIIRDFGGGTSAGAPVLIGASLAGIAVCGLLGLFSGSLITYLRIKPFIVTLAMLKIASGVASTLADGQTIGQLPPSFFWLSRNSVVVMLVLYGAAHVLMSRTVLGRHLYAVGGNAKAAYLSGIRNHRIILFAYACSGALAGLGGVTLASQHASGKAIFGQGYELDVIAAVVIGGTSLAGGEGRIFGTLVGAFIIALIRNGMNMTGIKPFPQVIVFGLVILAAVLLDTLRQWWTKRGDWAA